MRERLDCAVFRFTVADDTCERLAGSHANGRLHLHPIEPVAPQGLGRYLKEAALVLRRYDAGLICVDEGNLALVRTALSEAKGRWGIPLVAVVTRLKAAALNDLCALGIVDFVRTPVCFDELRARIERLLDSPRAPYRGAVVAEPTASGSATVDAYMTPSLGEPAAWKVGELEAYALASASRCTGSKESFRVAKGHVIERFERAYIMAALGRHSGNIAMAARAAQKHRRAFWALMRKHDIDAAPYRRDTSTTSVRDG